MNDEAPASPAALDASAAPSQGLASIAAPDKAKALSQRRREVILRSRIWERSTGPKTESGKAKASQGARKHGMRGAEHRTVCAWLDSVKALASALTD